MILFEILNNCIENLLLSSFVAEYINIRNGKNIFIICTVSINTILSTIYTNFNIIGMLQTFSIQLILYLFLKMYNKSLTSYEIIICVFGNILLFITIYLSILICSICYNVDPIFVYNNHGLYIFHIFLSKILFFVMISFSLNKKPLLRPHINLKEDNYLMVFELLIMLIMAYYFLFIILNEEFNYFLGFMFLFILLLFFVFCFIFNRIVIVNQEIYTNKQKEIENHYKLENLKNLINIKENIDNTEHRINYILQSIKFDIKNEEYNSALQKLERSQELVDKISPTINTRNELFDFILNLEIKYLIQNKKKVKICAFISKHYAYDNNELINNIVDILKVLCLYADVIEIFFIENEFSILEVKFIVKDILEDKKSMILDKLNRTITKKLIISKVNELMVIKYEENLDEYL